MEVGYAIGNFTRGVKTRDFHIWYPMVGGKLMDGRLPLVIFSHGTYAEPTQSQYITHALAAAGYVVAGTTSKDTGSMDQKYKEPALWSAETCLYRREDSIELLNWMLAGSAFNISSQIGMIGHSLGGYAALAIGGAWPQWKDDRVRAVVGLSPYSEPFRLMGRLADMRIPVMMQGGTKDLGITPTLNGVYADLLKPKYLVVFKGAGHFDWSNTLCRSYASPEACLDGDELAKLISGYTVKFLNAYLKNEFDNYISTKQVGVQSLKFEV